MTDVATIPQRDGATYQHDRDGVRLAEQHQRVWDVMKDGRWYTPAELETATSYSWASIGARLRDFRKARFGSHQVKRENIGGGSFHYKLVIRRESLFA